MLTPRKFKTKHKNQEDQILIEMYALNENITILQGRID